MRAPDYWQSGPTAAIGHLLSPLGALYAMATSLRASRQPSWKAPIPVICLGNLVMGGAGKTLVGTHLARQLIETGHNPHIVIRGYGGALTGPIQVNVDTHTHHDVGDEGLLYAAITPTWAGADRVASAKCAVDTGANVIIMDDGFQNPSLAKTMSILIFDGNYGVGNGYGFPAGPLREFLGTGIKRANGIVGIGQLPQSILSAARDKPVFIADTVPKSDNEDLSGKRVVAFAGIGRPQKFFDSLSTAGADIVHSVGFPDHHNYTNAEIRNLKKEAEKNSAMLMTTAKDHVRLSPEMKQAVTVFNVDIKWQKKSAFLDFVNQGIQSGISNA
jgi:tetraacyldisaccharide 4'-kinase